MKMLSCKAMGDDSCEYIAKGDTEQGVVDLMTIHVTDRHPAVLETTTIEELHANMKSKVETL